MEQNTQQITYELIKKAASGDMSARDRLANENMGLVYTIAKRFLGRGTEFEDLVQIGAVGLLQAIDKFDESFGVMFSTYAVPLIIGEIKRFLRDDGPIKASRSYKVLSMKAGAARERLIVSLGRDPTIGEIANELGVKSDELAAAMEATRLPESLYATTNDSDKTLLIDKISGGVDNENKIVDGVALKEMIESLPQRERKIIVLRYFKDKKQMDIAKLLGISQVQVSRIEKSILLKLRDILCNN